MRKPKISRLKMYKKTFLFVITTGGLILAGVACNLQKEENSDTKAIKNDGMHEDDVNLGKVTTAVVKEDGKIELHSEQETTKKNEELNNDSKEEVVVSETNDSKEEAVILGTDVSTEENNSIADELIVERTIVTQENIEEIVKKYYSYLDERIEDKANKIDNDELYSTVWMANAQYIDVAETQSMIDAGLIPSDLTTLKTETDNVMSLIISENASKVAFAEAFDKKLDLNKLIEFDSLFVDETDKKVAKHSYNEYIELITKTNADYSLVEQKYINTRNFFNNCTKYEFSEIGADAKYFNHNYPVNFTQISIGAQYLIKGIMGPEFIVYKTGAVQLTDAELIKKSEAESIEFHKTINNVEGPISYINDKFNGICFDNEQIKTYVK